MDPGVSMPVIVKSLTSIHGLGLPDVRWLFSRLLTENYLWKLFHYCCSWHRFDVKYLNIQIIVHSTYFHMVSSQQSHRAEKFTAALCFTCLN